MKSHKHFKLIDAFYMSHVNEIRVNDGFSLQMLYLWHSIYFGSKEIPFQIE